MMIKVAALGGHGASGDAAGAGPDHDRFGESAGREAAQFGGVEQPTGGIGEESGEQHLVVAGGVGAEGVGDELAAKQSPTEIARMSDSAARQAAESFRNRSTYKGRTNVRPRSASSTNPTARRVRASRASCSSHACAAASTIS